jgi:hypothetical protein
MNFLTQAPVLAIFGADGDAVWQERPPGIVGEFWARGALSATSADGALTAFGSTPTERYDPTAPKHAQVLVMNTSAEPATKVLADSFAPGTGMEAVLQADSGKVLVAVAAVVGPKGELASSEVRIYDVAAGTTATFATGWVSASCLSADGSKLVLATTYSYNSVLVYKVGRNSSFELLVNSTFPVLPGTSSYAAECAVSNSGNSPQPHSAPTRVFHACC